MKKSFKFSITCMLCILFTNIALGQTDGMSNRVFQFEKTDYIVTQDGSIGFSEAFLYGSTDILGLSGEFSKPGYFVANFMLSDDPSKITITIKADDLFATPLSLNVNSTKIAQKQNVKPYSQRDEFAKKYPDGVSREFSCSDNVSNIVFENSQPGGAKMVFKLILRGKLSDLYSAKPKSTLFIPDTTRRSNTIYDMYETVQKSAQDVFTIKLNSDGSGMFYGNTDILDEAREGYRPGFYAVPMRNLIIKGNDISFEIEIGVTDISNSQSYAVKSAYENAESLLKPYPNHRFKALLSGTIEQNKIVIRKASTKFYDDLIFVR